jgi:2'-phosphotransferase
MDLELPEYNWIADWIRTEPSRGKWTEAEWKTYFVRLTKKMTWLLRNGDPRRGFFLQDDGYATVEDVLKHDEFTQWEFTQEHIEFCVASCPKQRFKLIRVYDRLYIRAQQRHKKESGVEDNEQLHELLTLDSCPVSAVHGTFSRNWDDILNDGIRTRNCTRIHLVADFPTEGDVVSGFQKDSNLFLHVELHRLIIDGVQVYKSDNNVLLTEGKDGLIGADYIWKITDVHGRLFNTPPWRCHGNSVSDVSCQRCGGYPCRGVVCRLCGYTYDHQIRLEQSPLHADAANVAASSSSGVVEAGMLSAAEIVRTQCQDMVSWEADSNEHKNKLNPLMYKLLGEERWIGNLKQSLHTDIKHIVRQLYHDRDYQLRPEEWQIAWDTLFGQNSCFHNKDNLQEAMQQCRKQFSNEPPQKRHKR